MKVCYWRANIRQNNVVYIRGRKYRVAEDIRGRQRLHTAKSGLVVSVTRLPLRPSPDFFPGLAGRLCLAVCGEGTKMAQTSPPKDHTRYQDAQGQHNRTEICRNHWPWDRDAAIAPL